MSLSERVEQLNREIGATVQQAVSDLRREISARLRESHDEILRRLEDVAPALPGAYLEHDHFAPSLAEAEARAEARGEARAGTAARRGAFGELRDALASLDRARSQAEILGALLEQTGRFASRAALLLLRGGEVRGWGGHGFGDGDAALRGLSLDVSQGGPWERLAGGAGTQRLSAGEAAALCSRIEAPLPTGGVLIPMLLRDRVAAALYADNLEGAGLQADALQILTYAAALAIETLPFRERPSTSTLEPAPPAPEGEGEAAAPAPSSAPAPAPVAAEPAWAQQPEPAPEPEPAAPAWAAEPAPAPAPEPQYAEYAEVEAEPEIDAVVGTEAEAYQEAAAPWAPAPPTEVPSSETYAETDTEATPYEAPVYAPTYEAEPEGEATAAEEPAAAWGGGYAPAAEPAYEEPAPEVYAEPEPEESRAYTAELPRTDFAPQPAYAAQTAAPTSETVLLPRAGLRDSGVVEPAREPVREPAPVTPLRPVPPPPPREADEAAAGTSEVRPPTDVNGPGWAFATTRVPVAPSDETLHEEARRLARLLVSEIKLYNEEQVEEGRRNRDLYERLKEDIDRSRQMYEERVDSRILRSTDYFYQELVRILAAGDSRALGI